MRTRTEQAVLELAGQAQRALAHWSEITVTGSSIELVVAGERLAAIATSVVVLAEYLRRQPPAERTDNHG
jgi:hypothetical protein